MNHYNPQIHNRRSIRLKGYDYAQAGLYFVTMCCKNRQCLFGRITDGKLTLNDSGKMVASEWGALPERFNHLRLHEYIVMPNHFHAILEIVGATLVVAQNDGNAPNAVVAQNDGNAPNAVVAQNDGNAQNVIGQPQGIAPTVIAPTVAAPTAITPTRETLGNVIGAFKSITTVKYIHGVKTQKWSPFDGKLWQRNYWEHIIRNEKSYRTLSEYIVNNPLNWQKDKLYQS